MRLFLLLFMVTSALFGASNYKTLTSNPDMYTGAVGFANQLKAAIEQNQLAIDVRESTTYDGNAKCLTSTCSLNDAQSWCSDQWLGYKIYIPAKIAGVSFQFSSTPTRPSGVYAVMASFVPDNAIDTERKIDLAGALEYTALSEGVFGSGVSTKALMYDSFVVSLGVYELKYLGYTSQGGGWLYIDITQASIFGDGEAVTRTFNLNYRVEFANSADIQEVLDTKYFDKNSLLPVEHTINVYPQTCADPSPFQMLGNTDTGVLGNQLDAPPIVTPRPAMGYGVIGYILM